MVLDVFWSWPFLFGALGLLACLLLAAWRDQQQAPQEPTQPPDHVVMYKTQAVRKSALYGNPDVNQRPLEK